MAELDDFVKRLGKEPMPADPLQRGLETIAYALALLALEVRPRSGKQARAPQEVEKGQRTGCPFVLVAVRGLDRNRLGFGSLCDRYFKRRPCTRPWSPRDLHRSEA